jgi:hypothetical protein
MGSRKFFWLILAMCILSAIATLLQLLVVYFMSLVQVPYAYENFNSALAGATDIAEIKAACSSLAEWNESERAGRVKLLIYSPLIALLTSTVCAVLATWALAKTRKAEMLQ